MKYPRTYHLPWSPGRGSDDKVLDSVDSFLNIPLIYSEKIDGSNVCLETNNCYARTHSGPPDHPSFNLLKSKHAAIKYLIPENIQIFSEYSFAKHSIFYDKLPDYIFVIGIRDIEKRVWLSFDETKEWANKLGFPTVPALETTTVSTVKDLEIITTGLSSQPSLYGDEREGVVVRVVDGFRDEDFKYSLAKMVRANHVQTSEHWRNQKIVPNKLKEK